MLWLIPSLLILGLLLLSPRWTQGQVRLEARQRRLFPGRRGEGKLSLEIQSLLPVYVRLERSGESGLSLLPGGLRALVWGRWSYGEAFGYMPRRRGEYLLPEVRVFVRDLLGLGEREIPIRLERGGVLVYPEVFALAFPQLRLTLLADGPEALGGIEDPSRFAGVREYGPGDTLNRLHWKATARQGKPMVREFARVKSSGVWLHLDLESSGRLGEIYTEHATMLAASLLVAADLEGLALGLSGKGEQVPLSRGSEHLARLLAILAQAQARETPHTVPIPPPGVNLILLTQQASNQLIEGALRARARASRVHLIALPEGFYLRPGEKGRPVFGKTEGVLRLMKKRTLLEGEGIRVHILRGNQSVLSIGRD